MRRYFAIGLLAFFASAMWGQDEVISLDGDTLLMDKLVIVGTRANTKIEGNALVTRIKGSALEEVGSLEEMLSRTPGMQRNGEILFSTIIGIWDNLDGVLQLFFFGSYFLSFLNLGVEFGYGNTAVHALPDNTVEIFASNKREHTSFLALYMICMHIVVDLVFVEPELVPDFLIGVE